MSRRLTVTVPGSTANLGPGFDALALALNVYCKLKFEILDEDDKSVPLIRLQDSLSDALPTDGSNLIYQVLRNHWRGDAELLQRVRITIDSEIPLGQGLGSSAAAIMGSVWAAYALSESPLDGAKMLASASDVDGHADNVSASLLGGLVICARASQNSAVVTQKMNWPADWCPLVMVPNHVLSTKESRAILPEMVSRKDAVSNIQRAALLVAAVAHSDDDALKQALHDKLHEPYRECLVPELPALRKALADLPVLGCVLSGAGASVLTLVNRKHRPQVLQCLKEWADKQEKVPEILDLQVDQEGLRVNYE